MPTRSATAPVARSAVTGRAWWPRRWRRTSARSCIFAPRRQATEALAAELARQLPNPNPLALTAGPEGRLVGERLARLLKSRVAYHHSGLSYAARAGVIEPLAKAGQLRVVVATMGLAAGINFSLRSVALAGESYRRDHVEQPLRPDEILQMFGRAGRRGIDEIGLRAGQRQRDPPARRASPAPVAAAAWWTGARCSGLMAAAAEQGRDPVHRGRARAAAAVHQQAHPARASRNR